MTSRVNGSCAAPSVYRGDGVERFGGGGGGGGARIEESAANDGDMAPVLPDVTGSGVGVDLRASSTSAWVRSICLDSSLISSET